MELTEAKIFEAFGYPEKAAESAEREAAGQKAAEGAKGQEVAEPAQTGTEAVVEEPAETATGGQEGGEAGTGEGNPPEGNPAQTEQERRENAARRRKQEQQAAVDQAVAQARQEMQAEQAKVWEKFFEGAGFTNNITGQPIRTKEEYDAWQAQYAQKQIQEQLQKGELTQEVLQQVISQNPIVQQAQQLVQADAEAKQQAQDAKEQQRIQGEIAEITKMNPAIRSVADLAKMPQKEFDAFKAYVDRGYSFLDSYKLSHFEQLTASRAEAARNAALNNARGKDHLTATQNPGGAGDKSVPPAQLALYRKLNPNASMEDIQKHWNKYHK